MPSKMTDLLHGILPGDLLPFVPYVALVAILVFILSIVPGLIWIERVVIALMQDRSGPNRVGPRGLLQTAADGVKLFFKEEIRPRSVDVRIYYLAPVIAMIPALAGGGTLPLSILHFRAADGHIHGAAHRGRCQYRPAVYSRTVLCCRSTGWCWRAGLPITNIRCWAASAPRRSSSAMSWRWGSRCIVRGAPRRFAEAERHRGGSERICRFGMLPTDFARQHLLLVLARQPRRSGDSLHHRHDRGDQPRPVRPTRGRI